MVEDLEFILRTGMHINNIVPPLVQGLGNGKTTFSNSNWCRGPKGPSLISFHCLYCHIGILKED